MKILNGKELILDDQRNHLDSYRPDSCTISLESLRSFRGPLFRKPVTGQDLFFAVSLTKGADYVTYNPHDFIIVQLCIAGENK